MFTYTADELHHLDNVLLDAFFADCDGNQPEYYDHLAACAREDRDERLAADMDEQADALRCGMSLLGGEVLP